MLYHIVSKLKYLYIFEMEKILVIKKLFAII